MNTPDSTSLYSSFLADGESYVQNLNSLILKLESEPESEETLHQAFRNAHSLKSEASYLNETEIAEAAHEMEDRLEEAGSKKNGIDRGKFDREKFDFLFYSIDRIQEMLSLRREQRGVETGAEDEAEIAKNRTGSSGGSEEFPIGDSGEERSPASEGDGDSFVPGFTDFEKELLKEARERGERFLRVTIRLDKSTAISYAKGYLVLNNLEQLLQVIKTTPPFGAGHERSHEDSRYRTITFYCTGDAVDLDIYRAVNVDQVERIFISPLSYENVIAEQVGAPEWKNSANDISVKIDGRSVDHLNGYVDELKIRIHRLSRLLPREETQMEVLTRIVDGLEEFARKLSMVELSEVFQPHFRMVRDLASKLGKKAKLSMEGCDIRVDRRAAEVLSEIVVHLIRNALDHGIEFPEERIAAGKNEEGLILIRGKSEDKKLVVSVSDDGAGIDRNRLIEKAQAQGIRIDEVTGGADELLRFLVYPGLTTLEDAGETSGRGYGLDLVFQKVRQFEGGSLNVKSEEKGTTFTVDLPAGFTLLTLQIVRCGDKLIAVPRQHIEEIVTSREEDFSADESGALLWNTYPVYTLEGRLYRTDALPAGSSGLFISYLGRKAIVLVDEVMFKKEIPEDRLTLYIEGSPYLHRMRITGSGTEFYYLSPSVVTM